MLTSVEAVAKLEKSDIVLGHVVDQMSGGVDLTERKLVMILKCIGGLENLQISSKDLSAIYKYGLSTKTSRIRLRLVKKIFGINVDNIIKSFYLLKYFAKDKNASFIRCGIRKKNPDSAGQHSPNPNHGLTGIIIKNLTLSYRTLIKSA